MDENSRCCTSSSTLGIGSLFNFSHSRGCDVAPYCGANLEGGVPPLISTHPHSLQGHYSSALIGQLPYWEGSPFSRVTTRWSSHYRLEQLVARLFMFPSLRSAFLLQWPKSGHENFDGHLPPCSFSFENFPMQSASLGKFESLSQVESPVFLFLPFNC